MLTPRGAAITPDAGRSGYYEEYMSDQAIEQSAEEKLMNLLGAEEGEPPEEEVKEQEPEEVEEEAEEEDSQEETETPAKLKLTHNGEEVEVDLNEAKNLAQQGYDYTQKTQKLADERKQVEMYAQAVKAQEQTLKQQAEMQQAFIQDLAKVTAIDEQLSQYEQVNWSALSDSDPVQAQKLWIQYQQLQNNRTRADREIQQKQSQLAQNQAMQQSQQLEKARSELLKTFPNWNEEMARELRESAKSYGYDDRELANVVDPRMIKLIHDATKYKTLQSSKPNVDKKVQDKPAVVKPGTKNPNSVNRTKYQEDRKELRRTGNSELAQKLIERML